MAMESIVCSIIILSNVQEAHPSKLGRWWTKKKANNKVNRGHSEGKKLSRLQNERL